MEQSRKNFIKRGVLDTSGAVVRQGKDHPANCIYITMRLQHVAIRPRDDLTYLLAEVLLDDDGAFALPYGEVIINSVEV